MTRAARDGRVRTALVFPYSRTRTATEMLFAPMGIAGLAAGLRQRGIETRCFDCTFGSRETVAQEIAAWAPAIIGVSTLLTTRAASVALAERLRVELPESLLVAGGPLATVYPRRFLETFDAVFRGESDLAFPRFCADYLAGPRSPRRLAELPLASYAGLVAGDVEVPAVHLTEEAMDGLPLPDRSDFDHARYQRSTLEAMGHRCASLMVTRGCPSACDFCSRPVFGRAFRRRKLDAVFQEIAGLRALGYDHLWVADDALTADGDLLGRFCTRMIGEAGGLGWRCLSRTTGIDGETARLMRAAGCRRVHLGIESGNDAVLRRMNKHASVADAERAVGLFHEAGIETAGFFIVGYPGETLGSVEDTFRLARSLPLDEVSFTVPYPLPGSPLYERLREQIDGAAEWSVENQVRFVFPSPFEPGWLERRIRETVEACRQSRGARRQRWPAGRASAALPAP
jgi:anaerobic magnesium-protoporphyrin IX monomethyl ester cyclase